MSKNGTNSRAFIPPPSERYVTRSQRKS